MSMHNATSARPTSAKTIASLHRVHPSHDDANLLRKAGVKQAVLVSSCLQALAEVKTASRYQITVTSLESLVSKVLHEFVPLELKTKMTESLTTAAGNESPNERMTSGGFELYLPPTPFSEPPEPARFVMLDDQNDVFYDIDYETELLENTTSWDSLKLYTQRDAAIAFPTNQWNLHMAHSNMLVTGFLVSISSRTDGVLTCTKIGKVNVRPIPLKFMNWDVLEDLYGPALPAEMKNGLLRHVFNGGPAKRSRVIQYVTPRSILEGMKEPWHRDGDRLNYMLQNRFVGGKCLPESQEWKIYDSD